VIIGKRFSCIFTSFVGLLLPATISFQSVSWKSNKSILSQSPGNCFDIPWCTKKNIGKTEIYAGVYIFHTNPPGEEIKIKEMGKN